MKFEFFENAIAALLEAPRWSKKVLIAGLDITLACLTVWIAFCLRFDDWSQLYILTQNEGRAAVVTSITLLLGFGFVFKLYSSVFRVWGTGILRSIIGLFVAYFIGFVLVTFLFKLGGIPRSIAIIQPTLMFIFIIISRKLIQLTIDNHLASKQPNISRKSILIYGSGARGRALAENILRHKMYKLVGFLDNNKSLKGESINGVKVFSPNDLSDLVKNHSISFVVLAENDLNPSTKMDILTEITNVQVPLRSVLGDLDFLKSDYSSSVFSEVDIEFFLDRESQSSNSDLMKKNITGKRVLITGSGGSIGSELCRQIITLQPEAVMLIDQSEVALYQIEEEIKEKYPELCKYVSFVLMDVANQNAVTSVFGEFSPHTVFHAAAYKHVAMLEKNPVEGLLNNVLSSLCVANAALSSETQNCVLISTDKAVKPSSVMGASKRLSELIFLSKNNNQCGTNFGVVRFGNVLGSSGSVIPKFRKQIALGRAVTLTHADATRFFMTKQEASQLVIQASALRAAGKIFLLDMGKPLKIMELAKKMILLSGQKPTFSNPRDGEIMISLIGLFPGEKIHEELYSSGVPSATSHPKIMSINDYEFIDTKISEWLETLYDLKCSGDSVSLHKFLNELPIEYNPGN